MKVKKAKPVKVKSFGAGLRVKTGVRAGELRDRPRYDSRGRRQIWSNTMHQWMKD
ncbi:MAG: hypothetical protein HY070_03255 [Chloroflexi bacterium]|nr:hypothetical protein [Chloroflexota bacterium]